MPEPAIDDACERPPWMVLVTALTLITAGVCGLAVGVLQQQTGRETTPFLIIGMLAVLGWGLLRRRNWARLWIAVISFPCFCVTLLMAMFGLYEGVTALFLPQWSVGDIPEFPYLPMLAGLVISWFVHFSVVSVKSRSWFIDNPPIRPFVVWNPLRWKFRLSTLLYLTFVVAIAAALIHRDPYWRFLRIQQWAASIDQDDAVYFPEGITRNLTIGSMGEATKTVPNQGGHELRYLVAPNPSLSGEPTVFGYALFVSWNEGEGHGLGYSSGSSDYGTEWEASFHCDLNTEITFPGPVQIAEYRDGKLLTSDMHITPLEFWSFYQHPDSEWTIEGIEHYVTDLRKRVAERQAGRGD